MCISAAAYAPMRAVETYRQTKPRGKVKKKGGKKSTSSPPKVILIMQTGHPYSTLFMGCLADGADGHETHIVILWWGFIILLRKLTGGGFAGKWPQVKCVPEVSYVVCYFFSMDELSHQ